MAKRVKGKRKNSVMFTVNDVPVSKEVFSAVTAMMADPPPTYLQIERRIPTVAERVRGICRAVAGLLHRCLQGGADTVGRWT